MFRTTEDAKREALRVQTEKAEAQGRVLSPVVKRFLLGEAPAKVLR